MLSERGHNELHYHTMSTTTRQSILRCGEVSSTAPSRLVASLVPVPDLQLVRPFRTLVERFVRREQSSQVGQDRRRKDALARTDLVHVCVCIGKNWPAISGVYAWRTVNEFEDSDNGTVVCSRLLK